MCRLTFVFPANLDSSDPPEVVTGMLSWAVDQQIFLLIHQILTAKLSDLEIGCQLDSVSGAGLLAITAENATREVNAEEFGITPVILILGCLKGDATDGASDRTEIAGYAAFSSIGIA